MATNLKEVIKNERGDLVNRIIKETQLEKPKAEQSVDVLEQSMTNTFLKELRGGNFSKVKDIFSKDAPVSDDHQVKKDAKQDFVKDLMEKINIPPAIATKVAEVAVPYIVNKISTQISGGKGMDESSLQHLLGLDEGKTAADGLSDTIKDMRSKFNI